jgi:hypothetical protein
MPLLARLRQAAATDVPDFDASGRLAASLGRIGNIAPDGRLILGLDSRDLPESALPYGPDPYVVPAPCPYLDAGTR